MIGQRLNHYEITAEIGRGGMGEVYRARDTKLGREVALKLLPPDFATDRERLQRFEREARLLASLSHRNVATIHGFEQDGNHRFIVLELVEGNDLSERLSRGAMPTRDALAIARQIAEGMEAAHACGIIHRDLKPANIKQAPDSTVKILDFGLARSEEASPEDIENSPTVTGVPTRDGTLLGTAPYMSPEQLKGKPVDVRTDIWAFGCVLYEMLTGASPFIAATQPEIMARILEHEPDWSALPDDLPPFVARLIRRCLAKDPHQRLHSAADIRIVMEEAMEAEPDLPAPATVAKKGGMLRTIVVAVVFGLVGAAIGLWLRPAPAPPTSGGETMRLMIPAPEEAAVVPLPENSSVAISPDGRFVVYVASTAGGDGSGSVDGEYSNTQLFLRSINGFDTTPIEGTVGGSAPFFSPDGKWIGFYHSNSSTLNKVARSGGVRSRICFIPQRSLRNAHWADDGNVYFSDTVELLTVSSGGGEPQTLATPRSESREKTYRFPSLLPGSRTLLFMIGSADILSYDDGDIALFDLDTEEIRVVARGGMDPRYVPTGHIVFGRGGKMFALPFDLDRLQAEGAPFEVLDGVVTSEGYGSMQATASGNGTLVYVAGGPQQFATGLAILHRDGGVANIEQPAKPYGNLRLSPDAGRIMVSILGANASLWSYDQQRGTMTRVVSGWDNYSPVWEPGGDRIAFGTNREDGMGYIMVASTDGSGEPQRLFSRIGNLYPTSWSPDGSRILIVASSRTSGMDLWELELDGTATPVIQTSAREARGRFSPTGDYIAYTSDETGRLEVYVQTFPATGRKWKLSTEGGDLPVWSREGDQIYYWNGQKLMSVAVSLEGGFAPSRAREVIEAPIQVHDYDVFPGGDRFVVLGRSASRERGGSFIARHGAMGRLFPAQSPDLHVVLNWFDELTRLAPAVDSD